MAAEAVPSICEIGGGRGWAGEEARGERRGPVLVARGLRGVTVVSSRVGCCWSLMMLVCPGPPMPPRPLAASAAGHCCPFVFRLAALLASCLINYVVLERRRQLLEP